MSTMKMVAPPTIRSASVVSGEPSQPSVVPPTMPAMFGSIAIDPIGTTPQLQAEVLKLREGLPKVAVSVYKGGGDAIKALLTGETQISSGTLAPAFPHMKAGTIKALAQTGASRWVGLPDVPSMGEAGYKDFVFDTYCGLVAPAMKIEIEVTARRRGAAVAARGAQDAYPPGRA